MFDRLRRPFPRFTNFSIRKIILNLQREQFEREPVELRIVNRGSGTGNQFAQARGEAGKFLVHAVFVCGWFSATAEGHDSGKTSRRKREGVKAML